MLQNYKIILRPPRIRSKKKELPPVTPLGTNRRGISKAAHGVALLSELSSTEEPGCSELLRPAVCSFRTIASVLRRMESRFSSRYRLLPQVARTYLCTRNLSDSPLGTWHRVPSIRKINQLSCQAGSKWRYMLRRGETLLMQFNPIMTMTA